MSASGSSSVESKCSPVCAAEELPEPRAFHVLQVPDDAVQGEAARHPNRGERLVGRVAHLPRDQVSLPLQVAEQRGAFVADMGGLGHPAAEAVGGAGSVSCRSHRHRRSSHRRPSRRLGRRLRSRSPWRTRTGGAPGRCRTKDTPARCGPGRSSSAGAPRRVVRRRGRGTRRWPSAHGTSRSAGPPSPQRCVCASCSRIRALTIFFTSAAGIGASAVKRSVPFPER